LPPHQPAVHQAGLRKDANAVKIRLLKAGVNLDAHAWTLDQLYPDLVGFEFTCKDHNRLVQEAETSRFLAFDVIDSSTNDPWSKAGIRSVGYTEIDVSGPVHLDVAIDKPGLCRAYLLAPSVKLKADALRRAQLTTANDNKVYAEIARRLKNCNPPIVLDDHVAKIFRIGATTLDGVNFQARDYKKLIKVLKEAKDGAGMPIFAHATLENSDHWALKASFLATDGTGFREVFRLKIGDRPLADSGAVDGYGARRMRRFAGAFADNTAVPDLSSLHCAVSIGGCNVHIDETGFVVADELGQPVLDADFLQHLVNELLFKTYAAKVLPDAFVNRVNLVLPSSAVDFNRVGVSFDLHKSKNYRVALSATCSIVGERECAGTVTVSGRF
jgi:hypothetical protein